MRFKAGSTQWWFAVQPQDFQHQIKKMTVNGIDVPLGRSKFNCSCNRLQLIIVDCNSNVLNILFQSMVIGLNKRKNQRVGQQQFVLKMNKVILLAKHLQQATFKQMQSLILVFHCKQAAAI